MPWQDVCQSVCPSVRHTAVLCLTVYTHPQTVFIIWKPHRSGFSVPNEMTIVRRGPPPPYESIECIGAYEKNHDFRPICRFISELMQDRAIVTVEGE